MKALKLNLVLATAAVLAALAASSCGSGSLNTGPESDLDLTSSTSDATESSKAGAFAELDLSDDFTFEPLEGIDGLEDPWAWDLKHIEVDHGKNVIENDAYLDSRNAHEYEAPNGMGFDGENWVPIMDSFTAIYDAFDGMSYVTYGLKGLAEGEKEVGWVEVHGQGEFAPGKGYYIALSNFETGAWEIQGPFNVLGKMFNVALPHSVSGEGYTYVSLIVDRNVGLEIDEIDVWAANPNV